MQRGDLVYIPQDVKIFDMQNRYLRTTKKPITGLLLGIGTQTRFYKVYLQGCETSVDSKFVYPLGEYNVN